MTASRATLPDLDALDPHELKALILSQHEQLLSKDEQLASRDGEIEQLKLLIAKLRRARFGRSSEKLDRQIEQLELRLEALDDWSHRLRLLGRLFGILFLRCLRQRLKGSIAPGKRNDDERINEQATLMSWASWQ